MVYQGLSGAGGDGHIHELWSDDGGVKWHHHDLTADADGSPPLARVNSFLAGYAFEQQGTQHIAYQAADDDVHELWWDSDGWHHHNLTADQPPTNKLFRGPFGYEFSGTWGGQQFIVYEGNDHQVHELGWDGATGRWHHRNLNEAAEVGVLALDSPTAYVFK